MTRRLKEEHISDMDVCFQLDKQWYLVPFYVLREFMGEWKACAAADYQMRADKLEYWIFSKNKTASFLEIIFKGQAARLTAYILYTD